MLSSPARSWEGQRPVFVASLPRVLQPAPSTPCDIHLLPTRLLESPLFLPLLTLIVFPSDKDLITHGEDLEPEPHSERKREGQPIRNSSGKQLAHGAVKAPCVSLWGQLRLLLCVCTSVATCLLSQRCVTTDFSFGRPRQAPGLRKGLQCLRLF